MKKKYQNRKPSKIGRPQAPIDWELVIKLLEAQNDGPMIASVLGIHYNTLYDRVQADHNVTFTEFSAYHARKGQSALLQRQFERALHTDKPSDHMLMWLGKQFLAQRDRFPDEQAVSTISVHINPVPI